MSIDVILDKRENVTLDGISIQRNRRHSDSSIAHRIRNLFNTFLEFLAGNLEILQRRGSNAQARLPLRGRMMTSGQQIGVIDSINEHLESANQNIRGLRGSLTFLYGLTHPGREIGNIGPDRFRDIIKQNICMRLGYSIGEEVVYRGKHIFSAVVQGNGFLARKHNVMISIDFETKELKYYDSKGKPAGEYTAGDLTVQNYLETLGEYFKLKVVQEFPVSEYSQRDIHSCGSFVTLKMIQEALTVERVSMDQFRNPRQALMNRGWDQRQ